MFHTFYHSLAIHFIKWIFFALYFTSQSNFLLDYFINCFIEWQFSFYYVSITCFKNGLLSISQFISGLRLNLWRTFDFSWILSKFLGNGDKLITVSLLLSLLKTTFQKSLSKIEELILIRRQRWVEQINWTNFSFDFFLAFGE